MEESQALRMLTALSQQTRLRIMRHLIRCGEEGASAGEVGQHVNATSSRASFHLSALENSGIIYSERQSRKIIYRAKHSEIGDLMSFLLDDCCGDHPDIRACCISQPDCC